VGVSKNLIKKSLVLSYRVFFLLTPQKNKKNKKKEEKFSIEFATISNFKIIFFFFCV